MISPPERVKSGISGLDIVLSGGFLKGGIYIIQGAPGAGKTIFANQVCFYHIARGARALYVTLLAEYHARMFQHLGSMSFFDASKIPDQITYLSGLGVLHESGLKGLLTMLRREIGARDATMLVLDGIVSAKRIASNEQAFNEFIHDLQAIAIASDCTVFMLSSPEGAPGDPENTEVDGIVEFTDELIGWSAASSLHVVKFRGSASMRGRHAFKITDHGISVYPRIEALLARPSQDDPGVGGTVPSGLPELDRMLGRGLPGSSTTMIIGPSGTGKTTLGLHFLGASTAEEPGLMFGFYETPARLDAKIASLHMPVGQCIQDGTVEVIWHPPIHDLLDAYGEQLLEAVRRRKVRRLFIDGLGGFQAAAAVSGAGRIGMFLTVLMNEMRVLGVTTVYTLEVPDIMGPTIRTTIGDLSSLAENLVMLRFVEVGSRLHRLMSLIKVRDSSFDQSLHQYTTSDHGLLIDPSTESARAVMAEFGCDTTGAADPAGFSPAEDVN